MDSIAIMNAKGGVGKSTLSLALAETLSAFHDKKILLVDADGQATLTMMVTSITSANAAKDSWQTIAGWLESHTIGDRQTTWQQCIMQGVGDVDDADSISLMPGDMDLTLLEREIASSGATNGLRYACRQLLQEAEDFFDLVIVDCAPGISIVTESWLRECDYHLIPLKPDILAVGGMQYLKRFRERDSHLGFAEHLGVAITMMQGASETDRIIYNAINENSHWACFRKAIPMILHIQKAALYRSEGRSYPGKYPGEAGKAFRGLAEEILLRLEARAQGVAYSEPARRIS